MMPPVFFLGAMSPPGPAATKVRCALRAIALRVTILALDLR
jgi:hypothetical protein